jgi:hypothetical protein
MNTAQLPDSSQMPPLRGPARTRLEPHRRLLAAVIVGVGLFGSVITAAHAISPTASAAVAISDTRVSHDAYSAHVEPSVAVNPRNPRNLLAASQILGHDSHVLGTYVSLDGGATWRDNGPLRAPHGVNFGDDITVAFDQQGTGYIAAMMTESSSSGLSQTNRGLYVWRTVDGGRTFAAPVAVVRHQFVDHPWLAVGTGANGRTVVYVVWTTANHVGLGFAKSIDSARHFTAPRTVSTPRGGVSAPVLAAGPQGAVYASFLNSPNGLDAPDADLARTQLRAAGSPAPRGGSVDADVVSSHDGGAHFSPARAVGRSANELSPAPGLAITTESSMAVDPRSGAVYVVYVAENPGGRTSNVMLARSTDGGRSWRAPVTVAEGTGAAQALYFQPQVVVDAAGGVDACFFALSQNSVAVNLTRSSSTRMQLAELATVTESPFLPSLGVRTNATKSGAWWIGDYQGLTTAQDVIYPVWNDTRTGQLELFAAAIPTTDLG